VSVYERLEAFNIGRCGDRAFVLPYSVRPRQIWMACERLERAALSWLGPIKGNVKRHSSPSARCRHFFVSAFSPTV